MYYASSKKAGQVDPAVKGESLGRFSAAASVHHAHTQQLSRLALITTDGLRVPVS